MDLMSIRLCDKMTLMETEFNQSKDNLNQEKKPSTFKQSVIEMAKFIFFALLVVIPIRIFIAQPFIVSGTSMFPTFKNGDYLIVDEISYRLSEPKRGDVVVFKYPRDTKKYFIKRIIALPGETIDVKNGITTIINKEYPEGFQIDEPYLETQMKENYKEELKGGEYYVMGDNRPYSLDSRSWGVLPKNLIVGKPFLQLFPLNKISVWPGKF